jgi:hypothetical protein
VQRDSIIIICCLLSWKLKKYFEDKKTDLYPFPTLSDMPLNDSFKYTAKPWDAVRPAATIRKAFNGTLGIGGNPDSTRDHATTATDSRNSCDRSLYCSKVGYYCQCRRRYHLVRM